MRTHGALDLVAFACDLALTGELVDGDARARIRVACAGRCELRATVAQVGEAAAEGQSINAVQRSWRFPMTLAIEPLASAGSASLAVGAGPVPVTGALVGECGLRPRPDGRGQQWFFALRLEPVDVVVDGIDPLLGRSRRAHQLLPAIALVDWSAG